jgi:perosamine synthetase
MQHVQRALQAGHLSSGIEAERLEARLAADLNSPTAVVSSGTAALYLALRVLGVEAGAEVIIPDYTCNSLYAAVCLCGATPVPADCGNRGVVMTADTVRPCISARTRAVIAPHTMGFRCDIDALKALNIPVIEDCAQSAGGRFDDGSPLGAGGDVAVFSFFATKLVPAGEGGAVVCRRNEITDRVRYLRDCDEHAPDPLAFNFKMSDICATLALEAWDGLAARIRERARMAAVYDHAFGSHVFPEREAAQAVCFRYPLVVEYALEAFLEQTRRRGVICRPLHQTLGGACPRADYWHDRLASVPVYAGLSAEERQTVIEVVQETLHAL